MHYQLTCSCGTKHAVSTSQAGQNLVCSCGKSLAIPTLRGLSELPRVDEEPAARGTPSGGPQAASKPFVLMGLLLIVFFASLPAAIFMGYSRWTMDTSQTEMSERELAFKQLDEASPAMVSDAWTQYASVGLGPPNKPGFYYVEQKRQRTEMALGALALTAAVSGLTAAVLATRARRS